MRRTDYSMPPKKRAATVSPKKGATKKQEEVIYSFTYLIIEAMIETRIVLVWSFNRLWAQSGNSLDSPIYSWWWL